MTTHTIEENLTISYFTEEDNLLDKSLYNNNFNILYLNIRSLRNKLEDLHLLITSYKCPIHVIILTESWLKESENMFFNLPYYTSYFSNRATAYGGVAIYVSEKINSTFIFEEEFQNSNFLVIRLPKHNFYIMGIYKSHTTIYSEFIQKLDNLTTKYKNSLIYGDFNINLKQR